MNSYMCQSLSCVLDMGHWVPKIGFWGKLSQTVFVVLPAVEIFNPCKSTYKWNTTLIHLHIIEGQTTDNIEWFFSRVNKGGVLLRISFMLTFFFFLIQTDNRLIFFFLMDFCPKSEEEKMIIWSPCWFYIGCGSDWCERCDACLETWHIWRY